MNENVQRAALAAERAQRHHDGSRDSRSEAEAIVHALLAIEARLEEQSWRLAELTDATG